MTDARIPTMGTIVFGLIAAVVGATFAAQPVINGEIARQTSSPFWATMVSISVSLICLIGLAVAGVGGRVPTDKLLGLPPWVLLGGAIGVGVVMSAVWLTPIIGVTAFFSWLIAGQLIASLVMDHFGVLGLPEAPISLWRIVGVALTLGGALLVKYG